MDDTQTILAVLRKHLPDQPVEKLAEIAAEVAMETGLAETVAIPEFRPEDYAPDGAAYVIVGTNDVQVDDDGSVVRRRRSEG